MLNAAVATASVSGEKASFFSMRRPWEIMPCIKYLDSLSFDSSTSESISITLHLLYQNYKNSGLKFSESCSYNRKSGITISLKFVLFDYLKQSNKLGVNITQLG